MLKLKHLSGIPVILDKDPGNRSVACSIAVRCGSRNERERQAGASHLLEHMLFKWSSKASSFKIMNDIENVGGYINAETSHDYTIYYAVVPKKFWKKAIFSLTSLFFFPTFLKSDEVTKEMQVVIQEMQMYNDHPGERSSLLFYKQLFKDTSLSHPIIGNSETLHSLIEDKNNHISDFYGLSYRQINTVITVSGNIDEEECYDYVQQVLPTKKNFGESDIYNTKIRYNYGKFYDYFDTKQANIVVGRALDINYTDPSYYSCVIANQRLGRGGSSILMQELREKNGLVYSIYSDIMQLEDGGIFTVALGCGIEQANKAVELIYRTISSYIKSYTEKDFENDKMRYRGLIDIKSYSNTLDRSRLLSLNYIFTKTIVSMDDLLKKIENSKFEDAADTLFATLKLLEDENLTSLVGDKDVFLSR